MQKLVLHSDLPLIDSNLLGNFTAVDPVVHQKNIEVLLIADEEFLETVWKQVTSLVVLLATNLWHFLGSLHSSSGEAINTSDLSVVVRLN